MSKNTDSPFLASISNMQLIVALVLTGLIGGAALLIFRGSDETGLQHLIGDTAFGILFQLFVLILLGGGISFAHQMFLQARQTRDARLAKAVARIVAEQEILSETKDDLFGAYGIARRVRRVLRGRVLRAPDLALPIAAHKVLASVYDAQISDLIDAHLQFDQVERRVRDNRDLFISREQFGRLMRALDSIRAYLETTIEEYEAQRAEFAGEPAERSLAALPALAEFLGPGGAGPGYWTTFEQPFKTALRILRLEMKRDRLDDATPPTTGPEISPWDLGIEEGGPVRLARSHPKWPIWFAEEAARLSAGPLADLGFPEHIGSTAVPGLVAEPVIDMLVEVQSIEDERELLARLAACDYEEIKDGGPADAILLRRRAADPERCIFTLTIVTAGADSARNAIRIRNLLRADRRAARAFEDSKRALMSRHRNDQRAYVAAVGQLASDTLAAQPDSDEG